MRFPFIEHELTTDEIRIIIESVRKDKNIPSEQKSQLMDRLQLLGDGQAYILKKLHCDADYDDAAKSLLKLHGVPWVLPWYADQYISHGEMKTLYEIMIHQLQKNKL